MTQDKTGKPLAKVYVKVFARLPGGRVRFHKDGYTDLRGRFDYASLSGAGAKDAERYAILVLSDQHGAVSARPRLPPDSHCTSGQGEPFVGFHARFPWQPPDLSSSILDGRRMPVQSYLVHPVGVREWGLLHSVFGDVNSSHVFRIAVEPLKRMKDLD